MTEYSTFLLSTSCFLLDAYVEEEGSSCLRREQELGGDGDRLLLRLNAMDECSKNKICVGIEFEQFNLFKLCLDSIYKSTAWDKYEKLTNQVFKKANNYGKYAAHEAT